MKEHIKYILVATIHAIVTNFIFLLLGIAPILMWSEVDFYIVHALMLYISIIATTKILIKSEKSIFIIISFLFLYWGIITFMQAVGCMGKILEFSLMLYGYTGLVTLIIGCIISLVLTVLHKRSLLKSKI